MRTLTAVGAAARDNRRRPPSVARLEAGPGLDGALLVSAADSGPLARANAAGSGTPRVRADTRSGTRSRFWNVFRK
jgi:hypothetical protein